jgi:CheY-like chemotaxis protein
MMPGMDGIETTHLIRKHDSEYARTIPVIALTANAVAGNEQMFLDEGFQAFVSKPINVIKLDLVIRKWIIKDRKVDEPVLIPAEQPVAEQPAALPPKKSGEEIPGINMRLALSLYEDEMDILTEVMRSYSENVPTELARMRELSADNLSEYAIDIHTLKGASSSIGAKDLTQRAKKMEMMAKSGDFEGVSELNERYIEDVETLIANMKDWLEANPDL